ASATIHAGVDSLGRKLSLSQSLKDILLCGPSNEGLVEPIQCTSLSLITVTEELLNTMPNDARSPYGRILWLWHKELKREAFESFEALNAKGASASST